MPRWLFFVPFLLIASFSFSQDLGNPTHHVSGTVPIASSQRELSAERGDARDAPVVQPSSTGLAAQGHTWQLLTTLPGVIIHDISFPTAKIGYAVGELGEVWKTTDGGSNWVQQVLSNATRRSPLMRLRHVAHAHDHDLDLARPFFGRVLTSA